MKRSFEIKFRLVRFVVNTPMGKYADAMSKNIDTRRSVFLPSSIFPVTDYNHTLINDYKNLTQRIRSGIHVQLLSKLSHLCTNYIHIYLSV